MEVLQTAWDALPHSDVQARVDALQKHADGRVRTALFRIVKRRGKIVVVDFGVRTTITGIEFSVAEGEDGQLHFQQEVRFFLFLFVCSSNNWFLCKVFELGQNEIKTKLINRQIEISTLKQEQYALQLIKLRQTGDFSRKWTAKCKKFSDLDCSESDGSDEVTDESEVPLIVREACSLSDDSLFQVQQESKNRRKQQQQKVKREKRRAKREAERMAKEQVVQVRKTREKKRKP